LNPFFVPSIKGDLLLANKKQLRVRVPFGKKESEKQVHKPNPSKTSTLSK
jgi:hypothetical protein